MKSYLDKIFILEGILLAIIGVLFFINPVNAFFNFTTICGILIIIAGILRIIRAFGTDSKMYYILTGIIDILFGFIIWFNPISTTETLIIVFGIWILLKGIYSIILAFKYKTFGFNAVTILSIIYGFSIFPLLLISVSACNCCIGVVNIPWPKAAE